MQIDSRAYSEPILHLNAYLKWKELLTVKLRGSWASKCGINVEKMNSFVSDVDYLLCKVDVLIPESDLHHTHRSSLITPEKLNIYRLILTWISADNIMYQKRMPSTTASTVTIDLSDNAEPQTAVRHLLRPYTSGLGEPESSNTEMKEIPYVLVASKLCLTFLLN